MRVSRLGTDGSLPPDYQVFGAASELGRSILAAGQPSSFRPTDRGCEAAIQGAAAHRRIRRRDQGRAVGDESASRNWKFESTSLQQTVHLSRDFSFPYRKAGSCRGRARARPGGTAGRDTLVVNSTPTTGNISVGSYSSTAVPARRLATVVALVRPSEVGLAM
jgi:hypothetical protein